MMLQMLFLTLYQQTADCRLQTAIFSQNSRTQSEPDAQDHSKWSATSYLADQASQMTAVGLTG